MVYVGISVGVSCIVGCIRGRRERKAKRGRREKIKAKRKGRKERRKRATRQVELKHGFNVLVHMKEEDEGFKMAPSNFVPTINEGVETYGTTWLGRDESSNPQQRHDVELIKDKKRYILTCTINLYYIINVELK